MDVLSSSGLHELTSRAGGLRMQDNGRTLNAESRDAGTCHDDGPTQSVNVALQLKLLYTPIG
jgi:hypothetical protein